MTTPIPYTLTNESVTVVLAGQSYTVKSGAPNYAALREAVMTENWDEVPDHITIKVSLERWAKGKFTIVGDQISYAGKPLPSSLNQRIVDMARDGQDPTTVFRFWERLQGNPSHRSVTQLWEFMQHQNIPLFEDGYFLAYKAVRADYLDCHSGTIDNSPGQHVEMPRNQISDDPKDACHQGLHVGAIEYAQTFGGADRHIVVCRVDPANVVCVPYDESHRKMRVCAYDVLGNYGSKLPSTAYTQETAADYPKEKKSKESKAKGKKRHHMDEMDSYELMGESIETLRRYAFKRLKIVGASKIPGGKVALVSRILDVRRS